MVGMSRTMSTPGVSAGTRIIELPWYGWTTGLAGLGCCVANTEGSEGGRPEDLVHHPDPPLPEPATAELAGQVRGPQASVLHLCLEWPHCLHEGAVVEVDRLEGEDLVAHEG